MAQPDSMAVPAEGPFPRSQIVRHFAIELVRWGIHLGALGVFFVGVSWPSLAAFAVLFVFSSFGVTLCYHRYFAHRCFKTSRWFQFVLALWGATNLQRGPVWWAAVHRHHHARSDQPDDWHSPRNGFWQAHMGWLGSPRILTVGDERVPDLARYPELRFLDVWYHLPSVVIVIALAWLGGWLEARHPELGATAWQMVVWGFFVKATLVWQLSFMVNSVHHRFGPRRYDTGDDSRNCHWSVGLLTFGDGYHNNHHHRPGAARHGFFDDEPDPTWWLIRLLERLGLVWDVRPVPAEVIEGGAGR